MFYLCYLCFPYKYCEFSYNYDFPARQAKSRRSSGKCAPRRFLPPGEFSVGLLLFRINTNPPPRLITMSVVAVGCSQIQTPTIPVIGCAIQDATCQRYGSGPGARGRLILDKAPYFRLICYGCDYLAPQLPRSAIYLSVRLLFYGSESSTPHTKKPWKARKIQYPT